MAQIIKHRRGSIDSLKGSLARKGELVIATGSIGNMNGPWVFVGDNDANGAYKPTSQIYRGNAAPTISNLTYGSTLDGTPFYSITSKSLFILDSTGNAELDLTGNIEGNTISGVTINNLESTNVTASFISGAFYGDAGGLYNIPASGVTNLDLSRIVSGSATASISPDLGLQVNTHIRTTDNLYVTGTIHVGDNTASQIYNDGALFVEDHDNGVTIQSNNYAELQSGNASMWVESDVAYIEANTVDIYSQDGPLYLTNNTTSGSLEIKSRNGGKTYINTETGNNVGDVHILSGEGNVLNIFGDTTLTGSLYATKIVGTGSIYLKPDQGDDRYFEIYNTSLGDTHIKASGGYSFFGDDINYLKIDDASGSVHITGVNGVFVSSSLNVNGNTSVTGALYVADGSAIFDQALVAQNSDMLLTSGSNLIVQDGGRAQVDYIRGNSQEWNYLALNSNGVFSPNGVELSSATNISLWAEGGFVNVTGSLNVTGDIVFSGSINLGDFTGDTINFNGEVSSSILPQTGSSFDLGSSGQTWNNVWAENAHFTNIDIGAITLNSLALPGNLTVSGATQLSGSVGISSLTETRVVTVGNSGSIVDYSGFTYVDSTGYLAAPIIHATNDGNGTNFKVGNDMWIGDVNEANTMRFMGADDNEVTKIYLNSSNTNNQLYANYGDVTLQSNNQLNLKSQNSSVYLESYDGTVYINDDSGNNTRIGGNTYINDNLYVNRIYDDSDNFNYLQLDGWNTDDGYWWEGGDGNDTTLLNNTSNANVNILQTNSGDVNIDATGGSVNIHSQNGTNITGSLVVSDGSGVFNSSLIAYNSNLTLDNGSNIEMNEGHIYFNNGCGDIYYNTGNDRLTIFNDCGDIKLGNNTYINDDFYIENGNTLYTNYIYGWDDGNLNLGAYDNVYIYSENSHYVEIYANNNESGTNRLKVQESGISIETYDIASDLTHKVTLDNTGSLKLDNVALQLSGSLTVDGNSRFNNNLTVGQDLYVSGNFQVLGTGSIITLTGSQIDIGTNLINLNTYAPFERFAGINVFDSGSNVGVTGSLLWDSQNDVWIYANPSGSNYASARFIAGPKNTGSLGEEEGLTVGHFPIATGDDHISDSLLTYQGTELALNTNKFTVDSDSGDTLIHGNFTIEGVGGVDNEGYSSYIVFRNSDNVLGFVDTTDTENVTDRLLGYNASTGTLEFSSLIDGGTY